jgi:hypothetical protein
MKINKLKLKDHVTLDSNQEAYKITKIRIKGRSKEYYIKHKDDIRIETENWYKQNRLKPYEEYVNEQIGHYRQFLVYWHCELEKEKKYKHNEKNSR